MFVWSRSFFLRCTTADPSPWGNFTPPTKHECGETLGDLEPVYDLFPITGEFALPEAVTQTCMCHLVKQVVFLTVNHRGPLPLRELHPTDDTRVWRDPGGFWACLWPVFDNGWIRFARSCDTGMYVAFLWNKARGESGNSYGESSGSPHIKRTSPLKQDCGETGVGRGTLELA